MEVVVHYGKKIPCEVVYNHGVEEATYHDKIGLREFDFNYFDKDKKGLGREGSSEFPYLLMLSKRWPDYWKTQLKRMNHKLGTDNGK